jgi:hypothetical protein
VYVQGINWILNYINITNVYEGTIVVGRVESMNRVDTSFAHRASVPSSAQPSVLLASTMSFSTFIPKTKSCPNYCLNIKYTLFSPLPLLSSSFNSPYLKSIVHRLLLLLKNCNKHLPHHFHPFLSKPSRVTWLGRNPDIIGYKCN